MIADNPSRFTEARLLLHEKIACCDLKKAERWCLFYIRERSFDIGLTRAWIPLQRYFRDRTGLYKADVSRALRRLQKTLVIEEKPAGLYGINVMFDNWRVKELKPRGQILMDLDGGPKEDLNEALRRTFVEIGKGNRISPTRDTGTSLVVHPGRMDQSGGDVCLDGSVGGSGRSAGPEPGNARRAPGENPSGPTGGDPRLEAEGVGVSPQVSKSLTVITGASLDAVSKSLTTAILPNDDRDESAAVSESLTPNPAAARVSPQTPLVQNRYGITGTTEKPVKIADLTGTGSRAREGVSKSLTRRIDPAEEARLMDLLGDFFAKPSPETWEHEMQRSHKFWRLKVVRNFPEVLDEALGEVRYLDHTNFVFKWKPAFLMRRVLKMTGLKSWDSVQAVYDNPRLNG